MCKSYSYVFVEKSSEKKIKQVFLRKGLLFLVESNILYKENKKYKTGGIG